MNIKQLEKFPEAAEKWREVFNTRSEKVGYKKACHSANAIFYAEVLKEFRGENPDVEFSDDRWTYLEEEEKAYPTYTFKDLEIILTKDKSVVKDYPQAKHISDAIKNHFERETISRVIEDNDLHIDNDFYYVIKTGNK